MLIDTSGWFCIFNSADRRHARALKYYLSATERITHSYILAEFVALSEARKQQRPAILEFISNLLIDSEISIVWVDELLTMRAIDLLANRKDKAWSLCDAVSFVIMDEQSITEALTTDHDFEQAGFVKLLDS